jgi:YesN/AraC family two-component response regulator
MKILIVDDSTSWREFHKNAIEEIFIELDIEEYEIELASSARQGYDCLMFNNENPYNLIITDLQMEEDFEPKYAGEWFVEQIQTFKNYINTKIVISSGCYNIKQIAESLGTNFIPKRVAVSDINKYKSDIIQLLK